MKFDSFRYLLKQGWKNMGANRMMTFASIGVLTACFIITGVAALLTVNVNNVVDYLAGQNEIVVNVLPELSDEQAHMIGDAIWDVSNVSGVVYVSKQEAFAEVERMLQSYGNLLEGFELIFPAQYHVTVEDLSLIEQTNAELSAIAGVERTHVPIDLAGVMITIKNAVTYGGWGLVAILVIVSVIIISNTIRLTVFARRRELNIMKYVGATNVFIRFPFFVEGMTVGIIAGLVASGIVCGAYFLAIDFLYGMYNVWVLSLLSSLLPLSAIWYYVLIAFVVMGVLIGGIGTSASVRKHLEV